MSDETKTELAGNFTFEIEIDEKGDSRRGTPAEEKALEMLESLRSCKVRVTFEVLPK